MTSLDLHQLEQLSLRVSPVRKSPSADDLSAHSYPRAAVPVSSPTAASTGSRSSSSTTSSVMEEFSEELVEERLQHTSKQLQSEIELIVSQLTRIGQEMNCGTECSHLIADHDDTEHHKNMRIGRKKFNRTPKEGVKYLIEKGLLNHTVEDIGMFLFVGELLDKTAIGEYLGEWKEFNIKVLENFVQLHDFTGMNLVEALRYFLSSFMLPGEAQKIDRMMELFARHYCTCNPGVFCNPDACYVLSFSVIMLNTSLHNPNVKDKPSVEQFISMNRAINDGKDFPPEMLRRLFDNIKSEPFHVHEGADDLTHVFFNPDHAGWLTKEGGKHKSWRKRYFILSDNCLYYFKTPNEKEPRGIIPLENLAIKECHDVKKPFCFEISSLHDQIHSGQVIKACKTTGDGKVVTGNHEVYRIQAKSQEEMEEWMKRIRASISSNPFLEILQQRRQRVSQKGPVML